MAYDRWSGHPGTFRLWQFGSGPTPPYPWGPGLETFRGGTWKHQVLDHVSWGNARPASVTPIDKQYVCGSGVTTGEVHQGSEVLCWRLDGSRVTLVVAPVMTDLNASGGGASAYNKFPKGNLDVTGQYFMLDEQHAVESARRVSRSRSFTAVYRRTACPADEPADLAALIRA